MEERPEGGKKKRIPSNIPLDLYSALAAPYSKKIVEATLRWCSSELGQWPRRGVATHMEEAAFKGILKVANKIES